jgi:hypothetical protein
VRLTYREKRSSLDDLAYWMIKNGWSEVSAASASARVEKRLDTLRADPGDGLPITPQNVLRLFVDRTGMLREPVHDRIDFAHRTFQEFMAAHAAVDEGDFGILLQNASNAEWREVVILAAALARPSERNKFIDELLKAGDSNPKERPKLHLLAAACLEAATDVAPAIRLEVKKRIKVVVPPRTISEAAQLAEAVGDMAVPFLQRQRWSNAREQSACVRALALIGSPEAVQVIAQYAQDWSTLVQREVVRSAQRIDKQLFLEAIAPNFNPDVLSGDVVAELLRKFGPASIPKLKFANSLRLSGEADADLSLIAQVPNVRNLELDRLGVVDLNLIAEAAGRLERLYASYTAVKGVALLHRLERLSMGEAPVDLVEFAGLPHLRELSLASCDLHTRRHSATSVN